MNTVNVRIRQIGKATACGGVHLCSYHEDPEAYLDTPKLRPGEVITVPEGHKVLHRDLAHVIEITTAKATRPLRFRDRHSASAYELGDAELAGQTQGQIDNSLAESARIREENKQRLLAAGIDPEADFVENFDEEFRKQDLEEGLNPDVDAANALDVDEITEVADAIKATDEGRQPTAPPPGRTRRGS